MNTRKLIEAYDAVLAQHDLLLMPTTPMKAQPMPKPGAAREETVERALEMISNTARSTSRTIRRWRCRAA
jgi:amidase